MTTQPANTLPQQIPSAPAIITVLADDLTGACDAAVAFLQSKQRTRVWLKNRARSHTRDAVQALNTNSREMSDTEAALAITHTATLLKPELRRWIFKKVDSAGRGPLAAELLALTHTLAPRAVLLTPALPSAGRTVTNGILRIQDAAGLDKNIRLADLFPTEEQHRIQHVTHPSQLPDAIEHGKDILICDASTTDDLTALAESAARIDSIDNILYAGSAGLAHALAHRFGITRTPNHPPHAKRLLLFCGTPHPVTLLQLSHLMPDQNSLRVEQLRGTESERETILAAFHHFAPDALLLTGGETAQLVLGTLGAESILLGGEAAPGIPWGTIQGGGADGSLVITKSGGFGAATTLRQIADNLMQVCI